MAADYSAIRALRNAIIAQCILDSSPVCPVTADNGPLGKKREKIGLLNKRDPLSR
jgi:hypothetical protein